MHAADSIMSPENDWASKAFTANTAKIEVGQIH